MLNILYTCDDNFVPLTSISVASVVENNKNEDICFFIATEKENSENFNKLASHYKDNNRITFKYLDCRIYDSILEEKKLDKWGSNSYYVYWKLFAYDLLDVDEVWYIDSDVICLKEISNPKISKTIGAVLDSAHADFNKVAHIDKNYYFFNTGTLFVDIKKWKQNKCLEKVLSYIQNMKFKPLMCDQDIIAASLQNEVEVISPKYNYFAGYDYYGIKNSFKMYSLDKKPFYSKKDLDIPRDEMFFYHCLNGVFGRPWESNNESPIKKEFEYYRSISAWPDFSKPRNKSTLFSIEKSLEILPKGIYNSIHNVAQKIFLRISARKANS